MILRRHALMEKYTVLFLDNGQEAYVLIAECTPF